MSGIATAIYCIRNYGKVGKGDVGRLPAAFAQTANSTGQAINTVINNVDNLGHWSGLGKTVGDKAARVSQIASKITNPLLVGAAAVRVAKDDDKKSAIVEEGLAMTGMFGAERLYKIARNTIKEGKGDIIKANKCELFSKIPILRQLDKLTTKLDAKTLKDSGIGKALRSLGEKISKLSSGKQKALFVAAELGLVATSIISFGLFKKLGQKITGRDKKEENNNATAQTTPAFTNLTTGKYDLPAS